LTAWRRERGGARDGVRGGGFTGGGGCRRASRRTRDDDEEVRRRRAASTRGGGFVRAFFARALHAKSTRDVRDSAALNPQRWLCWCRRARKTSVEGANAANNTYVAAIEWNGCDLQMSLTNTGEIEGKRRSSPRRGGLAMVVKVF